MMLESRYIIWFITCIIFLSFSLSLTNLKSHFDTFYTKTAPQTQTQRQIQIETDIQRAGQGQGHAAEEQGDGSTSRLPIDSSSLARLPYHTVFISDHVVTVIMNQEFALPPYRRLDEHADAALSHSHSIVFCACVKDVQHWLPTTLANLTQLAKEVSSRYHIIFYENGSTDDTLRVLQQYRDALPLSSQERMSIIRDPENTHPTRTVRLAKCRNSLVSMVHDTFYDYDFFAMIDMDELYPNYALEHTSELREVLALGKPYPHPHDARTSIRQVWDALSFNRDPVYYDAWAIRSDEFPHNLLGRMGSWSDMKPIQKHYYDKLTTLVHNETVHQFVQVHSAFCGFAFYRISSTIDCQYNGWNETYDEEDCEHVAFHYDMINKHQAKILISPLQMGWGY